MGEKWIRRAGVSKRLKFLAVSFNSDEVSQGKQPNYMLLRCRLGNKDLETRTYCCKDSFPKPAAPGVSLFHHLQALGKSGRPLGQGARNGSGVQGLTFMRTHPMDLHFHVHFPRWQCSRTCCFLWEEEGTFPTRAQLPDRMVEWCSRCLWWLRGHGPVARCWKQPGDPGWVHVFPFWKRRPALVYLLS